MRMRDLEDRSGFPRSSIHFYLREGVLSPPTKTGRNAAVYSEKHLRDLAVIQTIREYDDSVALPSIKRIVELARQGIEPELALALERTVVGDSGRDPLERIEGLIAEHEQAGVESAGLERIRTSLQEGIQAMARYLSDQARLRQGCDSGEIGAERLGVRSMSKLNQIQSRLLELSGGAFQKLADAYLHKRGYERINPLGAVIGADKTRSGTPDSLVVQPNGKFIFAEHTTQRDGLFNKLKGDLDKCLTPEQTGIPLEKIEEVVFCHTGQLTPTEENALADACQTAGVNLNTFGMGPLSYDLYQKYPGLARDFLGIEVDTGQVLPPEDFIDAYGKNALATPLSTSFFFRDEELATALTGLEEGDLVVISGSAGVGKSRLAMEVLKRFSAAHPDCRTLCILNRGPDLFEDLRIHFSEPGRYLLLVDDANRINRFDYVVQLLQNQAEDRQIKVVVTVRDYAADKIRKQAAQFGDFIHFTVQPFQDEELRKLVQQEYEIHNHLYLDRITEIAQGNPRLAIMAAQIAKREDTLKSIADVSDLYERYYSSIREDLDDLSDSEVLKVGGIVAFFRTVDRSHAPVMEAIEAAFGISPDSFWSAVRKLHELEAVDMYEDQVVRTSDQVLATYLFYRGFFKEKELDFSILLENFFPTLSDRLVDALSPAINVYSDTIVDQMRPHIDTYWKKLEAGGDEQTFLKFIRLFWYFKQTEVLLLVRERIANMPGESEDLSALDWESEPTRAEDPALELLGRFSESPETTGRTPIGLALDYLEKKPSGAPSVFRLLTSDFGFKFDSFSSGFIVQRAVIDLVWERGTANESELLLRLFLRVASAFLKTEFEETSSKSRRTISIRRFQVPATSQLLELRRDILARVFVLYGNPGLKDAAVEVLRKYTSAGHKITAKEAIAADSIQILEFAEEHLDPQSYEHCVFVQDFLDLLGQQGIGSSTALEKRFQSPTFAVSRLLLDDRTEHRDPKLEHAEYQELKEKRIKESLATYDLDDYRRLFDQCSEISSTIQSGPDEYQLKTALRVVFLALADQNPDLLPVVLEEYLSRNDPFAFFHGEVVAKLVETAGAERALEVLTSCNYSSRQRWLFSYYSTLPPEEITEERLEELCDLYRRAAPEQLSGDVDALLRYRVIDKRIVARVTQILLERSEADPRSVGALSLLFNPNTEANKSILELFASDLELLKSAYLADCGSNRYTDYDGQTLARILEADPDFLFEFADWKFGRRGWISRHDDSLDFSFLWKRGDATELMVRLVDHIRSIEQERPAFFCTDLATFFRTKKSSPDDREIFERQDEFLRMVIEERNEDSEGMRLLFSVISDFSTDRRRAFVKLFLENNQNLDDFKILPLEPYSWSYSGSAIPTLQKRADYIESLLPLVDDAVLLQHKQYLERIVEGIRNQIEIEKKRDFLEDW